MSETAAAIPLSARLPDEDDEAFLEVALACASEYLITGDLEHFPADSRAGVSVLTPREFIDFYRSRGQRDR